MRILVVSSVLGIALIGWPRPADAQRRWGPDQLPDCAAGVSREDCEAQFLAALLDRLGLPSAEDLAAQGYSGIRVFRSDAFGAIWPAVTALSRPADAYRREGFVEARTIHADGHVATLTRPIWEGGWRRTDQIVAAVADRPRPSPVPTWDRSSGAPPPAVCLDPPSDLVEIISEGRIDRWVPAACVADPTFSQASALREMVAAAFPDCGYLPIEIYGHGLGRLRACLLLDGPDPLTAIPVLETLKITVEGHVNALPRLEQYAPDVRLDIRGRAPVVGPAAVDAALLAGALGPRWVRILRLSGEGDRVTVHGLLNPVPPAGGPAETFTQVWVVPADGSPQLAEWQVPAAAHQGSE